MSTQNKPSRLKSAALVGLVALNALLLTVLICRHAPDNQAQAAGASIGDVIAVPGTLTGFSNGVVFLVDTRSQKLTAISVNSSGTASHIEAMRPIDLEKLMSGKH
jgi:hypothetical protein